MRTAVRTAAVSVVGSTNMGANICAKSLRNTPDERDVGTNGRLDRLASDGLDRAEDAMEAADDDDDGGYRSMRA